MLTEKEQLSLIEFLASENYDEKPEPQTNSDKLLLEIYRIIHSHREDACCHNSHKEWREESEVTYKKCKKYF
mgnify:CR=1 FL=1